VSRNKGHRKAGHGRSARPAAAVFVLAAFSITAQAQAINVEKWPDDVPCNVLKKDPDGSYEITVPITRFFVTHTGMKYKNTRETLYWDQKCKSATK
jgi:hypothetical protein